jgi:hypothetical protein
VTDAATALDERPFSIPSGRKTAGLLDGLNALSRHHAQGSAPYRRIVEAMFPDSLPASALHDLPWLPVQIFKRLELASVPGDQIVRTLTSSGTSGQLPSRILLDRETANAQTKALVRISGDFLGKARRPMVIIDDNSFLQDRSKFNARAAGILGFSTLGRDHFYLLDSALRPDWDALRAYLDKQGDTPILLFGFTFIVWQQFVEAARTDGVSFRFPPGSALIHGGGWKRLEERRVSEAAFKAALAETFGIERVHNYYGMVEQVGSIYFECEEGWLHAPAYSDVLIRDPKTLEPLPNGQTGLVQVLSLLPHSYPGHSLLTEDLGTVYGEDDCPCGRLGRYFKVHGRLKNVEMRGCSDTRTTPAS